ADRTAKTYSGGMRRRLDLAAALVVSPPVMFMDEPTTGLDPRNRQQLPCYQEIEIVPPADRAHAVNEIEVTFLASPGGLEVVISALTIIEAVHARTNKSRLNWVLSGLRVVPVGDEEARAASKLL
ncbi:sporulation protein, partial [Streptomyces sp. BE282]|uniref:sporulation protein n=1 Tax=Streptomyces sp. BE282 TaxID=3002527 RepID=UPI002E7932D9